MKIHTEMDISRATGVGQYTISKFVTGRIKSITPAISKVLNYADIDRVTGIDRLTTNPLLRSALAQAWDGTDEGAEFLARTICAMAPIIKAKSLRA